MGEKRKLGEIRGMEAIKGNEGNQPFPNFL
jgi:hypothetical protein